jgi:hypothetical protein
LDLLESVGVQYAITAVTSRNYRPTSMDFIRPTSN